jgi:hypothetical protein
MLLDVTGFAVRDAGEAPTMPTDVVASIAVNVVIASTLAMMWRAAIDCLLRVSARTNGGGARRSHPLSRAMMP